MKSLNVLDTFPFAEDTVQIGGNKKTFSDR